MEARTILVVDDSRPLVELFREHLIMLHKYFIKVAYDGKEALGILNSEEIDLIILDIQMPVMDGLQLLTELHNRKIWLPVIIMTGEKIDVSEETFQEYGIVDFINKPVKFEELDKRIEEIFMKRQNKDSFSGISLMGIMQVLAMERKTGIMTLKIEELEGTIFFKEGKVVDIKVGDLSIDEALEACIKADIEKGKIDIEYISHRREDRINKTVTEMLLDATRRIDERNR